MAPAVRLTARSQSLPTPMTIEFARVVTSDAAGAPELELPEAVAPMAPEPFVPAVLTPLKLTTVIEAGMLCEMVAVTVASARAVVENARQISAVPFCAFVRRTRAHVRPPPLIPVTVVVGVPVALPADTNARINSLATVVENAGLAMVVLYVERAKVTVVSMLGAAAVVNDQTASLASGLPAVSLTPLVPPVTVAV